MALVLGLLTALIFFAFFPWLSISLHAGVFGLAFSGTLVFGRRIAQRG